MSGSGRGGTARAFAWSALAAGALLCSPAVLRAQEGHVYGPAEVSSPPKPASMAQVLALVNSSYPPSMRDNGVGGSVQVQFVVGSDGKVEKESVQVLASTAPMLAKAGRRVAEEMEFVPAKKDGSAVRCLVVLPITYRP